MKFKEAIHYIGIFFFFITILFGGLLWKGESLQFIGVGIILSFSIYYLAKLMLDKKTETHPPKWYKTLILWILYIVIGVFGSILPLHFITVQGVANEDLKNNGNEKLEAIGQMRAEFKESVDRVEKEFSMEVSDCLEAFLNAPRKSSKKKEKKDILVDLYEFSDYTLSELDPQNIKNTVEDWTEINIKNPITKFQKDIDKELLDYYGVNKDVFNELNFNINNVYYGLDTVLIGNKNELEDGFRNVISKYNKSDNAFINLTIPSSTVQLNSLSGLRNQYSLLISIGIYLIIHLLILFPILTTRPTHDPPIPYEDTDTTQL